MLKDHLIEDLRLLHKNKIYMYPDKTKAILILDIFSNIDSNYYTSHIISIEEHDKKGWNKTSITTEMLILALEHGEFIPANNEWKNLIIARKV